MPLANTGSILDATIPKSLSMSMRPFRSIDTNETSLSSFFSWASGSEFITS